MPFKGQARIQSIRRYMSKAMRPAYSRGMLGRYARRGMISGNIANRIHTFKRVAQPIVLKDAGAATAPTLLNAGTGQNFPYLTINTGAVGYTNGTYTFGGAMSFQLAQAAQYSEIQSLFDSYRIKKVILRFDYSMNSAPSGTSSSGIATANMFAIPLVHVTQDYDSNDVPADRSAVLANSYTKTYRLDRSFTVSVTPRAQQVITGQNDGAPSGTTGVGGMLNPNTWIDCNSPQVPHFGLKFWVDDWNTVASGASTLRITPTYILEAKNIV